MKNTSQKEQKLITSFIRFNEHGACERVDWYKGQDGVKFSDKKPYQPNPIELSLMASSRYGETTLVY